MNNPIWQPEFSATYDFRILVCSDFVKSTLESKLSDEERRTINTAAERTIERLGFSQSDPIDFYKDSAFVLQFNLGENGLWMATDRPVENLVRDLYDLITKPIPFYSHNCNGSSGAHALMQLMSVWVEYTKICLDK